MPTRRPRPEPLRPSRVMRRAGARRSDLFGRHPGLCPGRVPLRRAGAPAGVRVGQDGAARHRRRPRGDRDRARLLARSTSTASILGRAGERHAGPGRTLLAQGTVCSRAVPARGRGGGARSSRSRRSRGRGLPSTPRRSCAMTCGVEAAQVVRRAGLPLARRRRGPISRRSRARRRRGEVSLIESWRDQPVLSSTFLLPCRLRLLCFFLAAPRSGNALASATAPMNISITGTLQTTARSTRYLGLLWKSFGSRRRRRLTPVIAFPVALVVSFAPPRASCS